MSKKAPKKDERIQIRLDSDCSLVLTEIAEIDPLKPTIGQLANKLIRLYSHTLRETIQRPG